MSLLQSRPLEILRIDSSPRYADSVSRHLTNHLTARLLQAYPEANLTTRDLAAGLPLPTEAYTDGILYARQNPTPDMQDALQLSNVLVDELLAADLVVLGLPTYNWTVPSTFKAYVDQISRPDVTFEYIDGIRYGKLRARSIYIIFTSGGNPMGGTEDFTTPYATFLWQTLGIKQVHLIDASGQLFQGAEKTRQAEAAIDRVDLPAFT